MKGPPGDVAAGERADAGGRFVVCDLCQPDIAGTAITGLKIARGGVYPVFQIILCPVRRRQLQPGPAACGHVRALPHVYPMQPGRFVPGTDLLCPLGGLPWAGVYQGVSFSRILTAKNALLINFLVSAAVWI